MCSAEKVTWVLESESKCISDCVYTASYAEEWAPGRMSGFVGTEGMFCELEFATINGKHLRCDCSCGDMIVVAPPSLLTTSLSYLAQSMVTAIVGLNMAFR